ncbi:hypothetical protein J2809_002877 [Arthrobacter pascens]|nr:hypothetical protein [Arthrobacter pascens]
MEHARQSLLAQRRNQRMMPFMTAGSGAGSGPPAARPACPPPRDGCVQGLRFLGIEFPAAGVGPLGLQPHAQLVFFAVISALWRGQSLPAARYSTSAVSTSCNRSSAATTPGACLPSRGQHREAVPVLFDDLAGPGVFSPSRQPHRQGSFGGALRGPGRVASRFLNHGHRPPHPLQALGGDFGLPGGGPLRVRGVARDQLRREAKVVADGRSGDLSPVRQSAPE